MRQRIRYKVPRSSEEAIEEAKRTPIPEMSNEQLWTAYGGWLYKICIQVSRKYSHIEPEDLLGEGFLVMKRSASYFDPSLGYSFFGFSKRVIAPKLHEFVYQQESSSKPRPKYVKKAKDKGNPKGYVALDNIENAVRSAEIQSIAVDSFRETRLGNVNIYYLSPDEMVDFGRRVNKIKNKVDYLLTHKSPSKRMLGKRVEKVLIDGEKAKHLGDRQGVSKQAINNSIMIGRRAMFEVFDREPPAKKPTRSQLKAIELKKKRESLRKELREKREKRRRN